MWQAGDALVLILPTREDAAFEPLLTSLRARRFVRGVVVVDAVVHALRALCAEAALGCRVALESEWLTHTPALIVSCAAHAHLSLALVVERTKLFEAHALGRLTASGEVAIAVDGAPAE
ncbi:hypothetical protein ACFQBQ_08830 [Granulicella cerasi]|uniref:Uncharacterized protein n=1 Tax=Granulicella cerasi TaxID=741063 RepID=A0ABW1ZBU1_9BACT|nr:hypothetical protein [Granulicella cerasi]